MKLQGAIFDLDGTLMDTIGDIAAAGNVALEKNGVPTHDVTAYKGFVGSGVWELIRRMLPQARRGDDGLVAAVLRDYSEYYAAHNTVLTRPYDGIRELLGELMRRGVRLSVLSNKPDDQTNILVREQFAGVEFDFVMGNRDDVPPKPNPASALMAAGRMGLEPGAIAFVGDSDVDMETAANAGMYGAGVTWGYRSVEVLTESGAKALASTPGDLLELF